MNWTSSIRRGELLQVNPQGYQQGEEVGELVEGDCFGEMGYLSKIKRTATVTAQVPVSLMKVNATFIEQVTADCQLRFYKVFLRVLIDRLSKTTEMVVNDRISGLASG